AGCSAAAGDSAPAAPVVALAPRTGGTAVAGDHRHRGRSGYGAAPERHRPSGGGATALPERGWGRDGARPRRTGAIRGGGPGPRRGRATASPRDRDRDGQIRRRLAPDPRPALAPIALDPPLRPSA